MSNIQKIRLKIKSLLKLFNIIVLWHFYKVDEDKFEYQLR